MGIQLATVVTHDMSQVRCLANTNSMDYCSRQCPTACAFIASIPISTTKRRSCRSGRLDDRLFTHHLRGKPELQIKVLNVLGAHAIYAHPSLPFRCDDETVMNAVADYHLLVKYRLTVRPRVRNMRVCCLCQTVYRNFISKLAQRYKTIDVSSVVCCAHHSIFSLVLLRCLETKVSLLRQRRTPIAGALFVHLNVLEPHV